jgi:hypothetical protein
MLGTMQTFMGHLTSWLPEKLQHPVEVLIYFALLGLMAIVPLALWLGWAMRSTESSDDG